MCTVLLPPGGYPIAVNKYIIVHTQSFLKPAEYAYDETHSIHYDDISLAVGIVQIVIWLLTPRI
jgi:hypothetical protein